MPNALARISEVKIVSGKPDRFDTKFRDNHSDPSLHKLLLPILSYTQGKNCSKREVATVQHCMKPILPWISKKEIILWISTCLGKPVIEMWFSCVMINLIRMDEKKAFIDKQSFFVIKSFVVKESRPEKNNLHPIWFKAYGSNAAVTDLAQIQNIAHFNTSPCAIEISSRGISTDTKWFYSRMTFIKN